MILHLLKYITAKYLYIKSYNNKMLFKPEKVYTVEPLKPVLKTTCVKRLLFQTTERCIFLLNFLLRDHLS